MLAWAALIAVKVALIVFFQRLAEGSKTLQRYCWTVLVFNLVACIYGLVAYSVSCPSFGDNVAGEISAVIRSFFVC